MIAFFALSFLIFQWSLAFICSIAFSKIDFRLGFLFAFILNLMVVSILFFLCLTLAINFEWIYFLSACLFIVILFLVKKQNVFAFYPAKSIFKDFSTKETLLLLLLLLFASYSFVEHSVRWGQWDAYTIWNTHAKFLTPDFWKNLFTPLIEWNVHPDYPNMLPSLVAILWNAFNNLSPVIPSLVSYVITLCIILLIWFSLRSKEININLILFSLLILVVNYNFMFQAASQYADTALALFFLLSFVSLKHYNESKPVSIILIGIIAASCSWIKNEGVVFFLIFSVFFLLKYRKFRVLKFYILGSLIPVLFILYFKIVFAPQNDMVTSLQSILNKITDPERYILIIKSIYKVFYYEYPALLGIFLFLLLKKQFLFFIQYEMLVLVLTFASFCFAYLITSKDLNWHLLTSSSRLVHQLYPSAIYLLAIFFSKWSLFSNQHSVQ